MSGKHTALNIFQNSTEVMLLWSTCLLPGTLAGLESAGVDDAFYGVPSVANLPGIDSILGDLVPLPTSKFLVMQRAGNTIIFLDAAPRGSKDASDVLS